MKKEKKRVNIYTTTDEKTFLDPQEAKDHEYYIQRNQIATNLRNSISQWYRKTHSLKNTSTDHAHALMVESFCRIMAEISSDKSFGSLGMADFILDLTRKEKGFLAHAIPKANQLIEKALAIEKKGGE